MELHSRGELAQLRLMVGVRIAQLRLMVRVRIAQRLQEPSRWFAEVLQANSSKMVFLLT
jgi:hypothetical protein